VTRISLLKLAIIFRVLAAVLHDFEDLEAEQPELAIAKSANKYVD